MQNENDIVTLRVQVNIMEGRVVMIMKKKKLSLTKRRFGTNSHQPL